ncbi:MAG: tRNA (adenine-N1)-methyltransferase [Actinomycetota bacterium]|nr:tRNA (adenine-N1)-methyltransferase [Actinomycetota bacterium]
MSAPFEPGERALLVDRKGRRYLITLKAADSFHTHEGFLSHDAIIGQTEGVRVSTSGGSSLVAYRPSYPEFVVKMPRGAQVIYPKDVGLILIEADIAPGAVVLEAGTGSGALTIALTRAVGPGGRVISYELREDFAVRARGNVEAFLGKVPDHLDLRQGNVTGGIPERGIDRVVLDLPEPWTVVPVAIESLRPGGIWCSYVPSIVQVSQTVEALRPAGFAEITTRESLVRTWHVEGAAVRPDHRMVAHTGFITTARLLAV